MHIPEANQKALIFLMLLIPLFGIPQIIKRINNIEHRGVRAMVIYLRVLLGFVLAAVIYTGYHAFVGK